MAKNNTQEKSERVPDTVIRSGRLSVSAWHDADRGWSFQLSRSYRDTDDNTRYEQMRLFATDLPVVAMLVQKAWEDATPAARANGG